MGCQELYFYAFAVCLQDQLPALLVQSLDRPILKLAFAAASFLATVVRLTGHDIAERAQAQWLQPAALPILDMHLPQLSGTKAARTVLPQP